MASPELALVDADLAERLRAGLATDDVFRPRQAPRPELRLVTTEVVSESAAADALVELDDEVADELAPGSDITEDALPDYVVPTDEEPVDRLSAYDFVVSGDDVGEVRDTPFPVFATPLDHTVPVSDLAAKRASADDLIVERHEPSPVLGAPVVVDEPASDYPVLPALDERSEALEETDAALRRIREQLGGEQSDRRKPRVRRRFAVLSGLGAVAVVAVVAVDVLTGVAQLPAF